MRYLAALLAGLLVVVTPAAAQSVDDVNATIESVLGEPARYEAAFAALKTAVADDDSDAVAAIAAYPLVVKTDGRRVVANAEEFSAAYDEIMTGEIIGAIEEQTYETLFVSDQGIMFGNGQVWLAGVCADDDCQEWDVKIITIQSTATAQ